MKVRILTLADAVAVAASEQASGVCVVFAGAVHGARDVQKVHPYRLDAFSSGDAGPVAYVEEGRLRVLRAGSDHEARRLFHEHSPDVVLADYRLGEGSCDGLELLQSLRLGGVMAVPGALITADHGTALAERARALGYTVLRKPVKPAALRAVLGALLASARTASAPA